MDRQEELVIDQRRPNDVDLANRCQLILRERRCPILQLIDRPAAVIQLIGIQHIGDDREADPVDLFAGEIVWRACR